MDAEVTQIIPTIRLVAFDFDGVFTDNTVYVSEDGGESVRCWRGDGIGLRQLDQLGIRSVILSTEVNPVVTARSRKLAIQCVQGCVSKLAELQTVANQYDLALEQIAFVGNDINDAECLRAVGLPIVVQDAHAAVVPLARLRTTTPGGYGAVREVCDLFMQVLEGKE